MAIGVIFEFGSEIVEVRIQDKTCLFRTGQFGGALAPIDSIKLDKAGSIKKFPDLKDKKDWKEQTLKRFKENLKNMKTEKERMNYIIKDLAQHGYKAKYYQQNGHRPKKIK